MLERLQKENEKALKYSPFFLIGLLCFCPLSFDGGFFPPFQLKQVLHRFFLFLIISLHLWHCQCPTNTGAAAGIIGRAGTNTELLTSFPSKAESADVAPAPVIPATVVPSDIVLVAVIVVVITAVTETVGMAKRVGWSKVGLFFKLLFMERSQKLDCGKQQPYLPDPRLVITDGRLSKNESSKFALSEPIAV